MKTKFTFLTALFLIGSFYVSAQDNTRIGGFVAYGTEIESIGVGANAEFPVIDKLTIAPSFIYYFPKTEDAIGFKMNWFEVNGNVNYYFLDDEIDVYGLGGLNYSSVKVTYDDMYGFGGGSASDGRFGLNLGAGANFNLGGSILPFAEVKYVIIDGGQLVASAGVKFNL